MACSRIARCAEAIVSRPYTFFFACAAFFGAAAAVSFALSIDFHTIPLMRLTYIVLGSVCASCVTTIVLYLSSRIYLDSLEDIRWRRGQQQRR